MPSLKLFSRNSAKPSLRERAASLTAGLARITGRNPAPGADTSRRSVVVGSLAAAVPLPALAMLPPSPADAAPHPDQDLFEIESLCARADAAAEKVNAASDAAHAAFRDALGPFPDDLLMTPWEAERFGMFPPIGRGVRLPTHLVHRGERFNPDYGWTAEGLQRAIDLAVTLFGQGGQTPHRIRRWRSLLPAAVAYDTRRGGLELQFRVGELQAEREDAALTARRARALLERTPAKTPEGLAVHARALASTAWYEGGHPYSILLQSAAAITGVALRQSDFDVPAWLAAWEEIGGRVEWRADHAEWAFIHPLTAGASEERKGRARELYHAQTSNSGAIHLWLEPRTADPRFASG